jgi:nicotinamide-nucleotide amidase
MHFTKASIITIGDELLIGQVIDTNSAWMAQELNRKGIRVSRRVAVGDDWEAIWQALDQESRVSEIILITGGLGPTSDDITKPLLCKYFQGKMIVHEPTLSHIRHIFSTVLKRPLLERNLRQAEVPDCCRVISNELGTAPGMWFEQTPEGLSQNGFERQIFVSMPGVPFEMKGMMSREVIPELCRCFTFPQLEHRTLLTAGAGESSLAELLTDFEKALPAEIKLAYLPNLGMVRLRLTAIGPTGAPLKELINQYFENLKFQVHQYLVVDEDIPLQQWVGRKLTASGKMIGTAESCTGGYIAHLFTADAGASKYFRGSVVCYSNAVKTDLLDVQPDTLLQEGAVSEQTVKEMAQGALKQLGCDYIIAVSGIMGPDGGSTQKPVGTVWIAVGGPAKLVTRSFHFRFDRTRNIQLTATNALNMLRQFILSEEQA